MKENWKSHGLTEKGAAIADAALESMCDALTATGEHLARAVYEEAFFILFELPKRTQEFQAEYLRKAGLSPVKHRRTESVPERAQED